MLLAIVAMWLWLQKAVCDWLSTKASEMAKASGSVTGALDD